MKPNCRLCKADAKKQTVRADFVYGASEQGKYKFYECSRCRVIYLFPFLTEEQEKLFYKKEFENFMSSRSKDRDWKSTENHIKSNQDQVIRRMRFLKSHLTPNKNILEIGCSSGFMLDAFKDLGLNCYAVEPSIQFLKFLTQEKNYKAYESLESLHQNCNINFDLIVHFFVFEHIANPFEFLQKIYNLLSKNGVMIFEIPCSTDPLTSLYNIPAFEKF